MNPPRRGRLIHRLFLFLCWLTWPRACTITPPVRVSNRRSLMSQQVELPVAIPRPEEMKGLDVEALVALWQVHNPADWAAHLELYQTLGKRLVKLGEPLVAYDVLSEGLSNWPQDALLRQQQALALSRSGAT